MTQQFVPGNVQVKTVSIYAERGVINATELVKNIEVYESIITPGFIVEMTIDDTRNILSHLELVGGEKIVLEYQTPGRLTRALDLQLNNVFGIETSFNNRAKRFTIECVTPEMFSDKSMQICKSYNTNISSMIEDVMKNFIGTKKNFDVQTTRGVQKIIVPSKNPFKAITMMRKRAVSVDDKSSLYCFYENIDGYHFKTIEKIFSDGQVGDRTFYHDQTARTDLTQPNFRNIISYDQPEQFDLINKLNSGGVSHEIRQFDLRTLEYKSTVVRFDPSQYKSADGTMKSPDKLTTLAKYGKTAGTNSMVIKDSGIPDTFISDSLGQKKNVLGVLSQGAINIHVFGDSELSAGQLIDVNILDTVSGTMQPTLHPQLSGKYVIAFIKHMIAPEGVEPRYTCSIEALKGGYK